MKYLIILSTAFFCYTLQAQELPKDNALARVNQIKGLYIFLESTPAQPFEYIETVKKSNWSKNVEHQLEKIAENALKECPRVEGLIVRLQLNTLNFKADCIKFKTN